MFNNNERMINKTVVTAFILGVIVAAFAYHAYLVYQMRDAVARNTAVVNQITQMINASAQSQQQAQAQQMPAQGQVQQ